MGKRSPNYQPLAKAQEESGKAMAAATRHAADVQRKTQLEVMDFYKDRIATLRADAAPYRKLGLEAMAELRDKQKAGAFEAAQFYGPGEFEGPGEFKGPGAFEAPGLDDIGKDPGYKFRVAQGTKAIERGASARGGLFSGRTGAALQEFGQQSASQEYDKVYGRALGEHDRAYTRALGEHDRAYTRASSEYDRAYSNALTQYKIANAGKVQDYEYLTGLAGIGANVGLGLAAQNTQLTGMAGSALGASGSAAAQGILGSANALAAGNVGAQSSRVQGQIAKYNCLLYTSPSPRDRQKSRMPSSA